MMRVKLNPYIISVYDCQRFQKLFRIKVAVQNKRKREKNVFLGSHFFKS